MTGRGLEAGGQRSLHSLRCHRSIANDIGAAGFRANKWGLREEEIV